MKKIIFITLMLFASFAVFSVPNEKTNPPSAFETIFNVSETATVVVTVLQPFEIVFFETDNFIGTNSNETTIVIYKLFETLIFECYIEIENSPNLIDNKSIYKDKRLIYFNKNLLSNKFIYKDKRLIYFNKNLLLSNKDNNLIKEEHNDDLRQKTIHYFSWYSKSSLC